MYINSFDELAGALRIWVSGYERAKEKFLEALERAPASALSWAEDMFQQASRYELAIHTLQTIKDRAADLEAGEKVVSEEQALHNVRTHALRNAIDGARYSGSSSSPCANMIKRAETRAWADLAALFDQVDRQVGFGATV